MRILIVDPEIEFRESLVERVQEALRQLGLKRVQIIDGDIDLLSVSTSVEAPTLGFLGPGCYQELEMVLDRFRAKFPTVPVCAVLANEIYTSEAVDLRRIVSVRMIALADLAQMAQFILDAEEPSGKGVSSANRGVISVVQLKGGVGGTSVATGLAACWARHDLNVALVDLDDCNPQITDWAQVGSSNRRVVSELLSAGEVPSFRVSEIASPVPGFDSCLSVVGQPERYGESFHFRADVIEGAPSSAEYIASMIAALEEHFDVVVVDTGGAWGIATLSLLRHSQNIILVTDDDDKSLVRSLENFNRLYRESDDVSEFDLPKWSVLLNGYREGGVRIEDVSDAVAELDLFPESLDIFVVPFSEQGRAWGELGESFYDMADEHTRMILRQIAFHFVPFRYEQETNGFYDRFLSQLHRIVS